MSKRLFPSFVVAVTFLSGCHLAAIVRGSVVESAKDAPRPVSGASVVMRCPNLKAEGLKESTDEQGGFRVLMESRFSRKCTLEVQKPGFESKTIALSSVCPPEEGEPEGGYCPPDLHVTFELRPAP